jgi:integrase
MLRDDLKSAKIPEETEVGVVDFHALRVTYITNLARSGIHPTTAQIPARHSDIQLTMKVYTKLGRNEVAEVFNAMPAAHPIAYHVKWPKMNQLNQVETK